MFVDSLYEGRSPYNKTLGISRLNTRLAFFGYERRKLAWWGQRSLWLARPGSEVWSPHRVIAESELEIAEYLVTRALECL